MADLIIDGARPPLGYSQVTVAGAQTLAQLGVTIPSGATMLQIQPEIADIRFRDDGVAPTASVGMRIYAGTAWPYVGYMPKLQLIAVTGSVTVNLLFYGSQ